jgi:ribosomal protein S18 acetylase RimI-like enzyme
MQIRLYTDQPPPDVVVDCVATYAAAFGQAPYFETVADAESLRERIARYSSRRGFRLPIAADHDGRIIGFGLAVSAYPGDWWRDRVADAVGPDLTARWLPAGVLEIVHVAVDPSVQRRGVGRSLLGSLTGDAVAAGATAGVLSCDGAAVPAQQLYLSQGWQVITTELSYLPSMEPRWLMGADLANSGVPG